VFGCATILGGVAPGARDTSFNGRPVRYVPAPELGSGARWCAESWLALGRGTRGVAARDQGAISRFAMHVSGQVTSGTVVVVPDEQVDRAAALAAGLLGPDGDGVPTWREWSMALVRQPGRTRLAVRLGGGEGAARALAADLDVEWFIEFGPGHPAAVAPRPVADWCTVRRPDGTVAAELVGTVHLEDEPVSSRLIEIAARHGDGLDPGGARSGAIMVPSRSHRPLEPDEWDLDRDLAAWIS
jgi:hypothetical protein